MKNMTKSRKDREKSQHSKKWKNKHCFLSLFDVIGRILALYCNTHTDCKQQHFLTRKQTQNPPIKPNFNPARPYSERLFFFFFFRFSFFPLQLKRQECSLVNVRPVWSPRFFGPALTFCWAKNKVHRVHTESFAALMSRKWNFTPKPKQTKPRISLHYLNERTEHKKDLSSGH